jgi:glucose-1-phosphate cytidylyltransferase
MRINTKSTSVILLVGGSGSRFSSVNEAPKQLSKLNNDLILMHIIKNFKKYGLNHYIFPLGFKKKFFTQFFNSKKNIKKYGFNILKRNFKKEDLKNNKINISYFDAGKNTNKMTRISKSLKYIIDKDLLVVYGDDLANINLNQVFNKFYIFKKKKAIVTIYKKKSQYGHVIINKSDAVKKFIEKPLLEYPINIGNYLITSSLIKKFKKSKYEFETNFIPTLVKKNLLQSHEHKGYFYSINDKKELIIAKKRLKKL